MKTEEISAPSSAPSRTVRFSRHPINLSGSWLWGVAGFVVLLAIWQLLVSARAVDATALPAPLDVWVAILEHRSLLLNQGWSTLREILLGFVLSSLAGFIIALLLSGSTVLYKLLYPLVIAAQAVPKLALVPIILIWFGFGATSNAVIAVLISIFPMIVNTLDGLQSIDRRLLDLGRTMGGDGLSIFRRIRLPSAMPSIFTGMKLCMSFATVGAVAGEIFAGNAGLGFVVSSAAGSLNSALAFAGIVVISLIGLLLYYFMLWLERRLIPWAPSQLTAST